MSKEQIFGIVRHIATAVGGGLILSGKADEALVQESIGALLTVLGVVWSLVEKSNRPGK